MRTRIYLERDAEGGWDFNGPHIDVNHEQPLTDEDLAAFRAVGKAAIATGKPEPVRACPGRDPMSQR